MDDLLPNSEYYRKLIGKLIYLIMMHLDISFFVRVLSQFMQMSTKELMAPTLSVLRYLKATPGLGVLLSSAGDLILNAFVILIG